MQQFPFQNLGKILIVFGAVFILLGVVFLLGVKIPFLGKLPGDINIKRENSSFHFPLVSCLIISVILTIILNLMFRK